MSYLALLWKARTIEKYRLKYEKEKINSILATNTGLPRNTLYQKWTLYRKDSQKRIEQFCRDCPAGSKIANSCTCLKENSSFLLRIVIGIVGGIVLMYCLYEVFVIQVAVSSVVSLVISVVITLGIVLSSSIRCLLLLLLPGLFSRVGRYTLACYALVLILTGPATNTIKNLNTLSDSLACGQEQIKSSIRQMKESKDSPLNLVKDTMSETVDKIQYLANKMKELLVKTHRLTLSIAYLLQSFLSWLNSVEATCNRKLGTTYEHCIRSLAKGSEEYSKEFPEFSKLWSFDDIVRAVCFTLKPAESLCVVGDFAKGSIVATIKKKLTTFSSRVQTLLSMSIHIRRSHSCCSNGSLPISTAAAGIVTDLRNRADPLLTWLSWSCTLTGLFLLLIIFRAKYYQLMFRTRSRFDNRYVTREFRELDLKRQRQGRETVLPLNTRERSKYVSTASFRLLPSERMYLTRSIVFMVITTFKLMIHMVADYSLYWVLMNIRFHGSAQTESRSGNRAVNIVVSGTGPLAATVRTLVEALSVPLELPISSPKSCLPDPNPPDLQRYAHIGTIILLLWLLALFEPYGLRLRHVITGLYQPDRAKARAVWLYYHIIRTRSCFLKCARRKLHRQYKYTSEEKYTFKRWLNDCLPCVWLRSLLGVGPDEPRCLLCFTKHRQDDPHRRLKRCETPSCPGIYCSRCFMDIGLLCTICYSPEEYGDFSDVSLEKFDSEDSESDDTDDEYNNDDNKPLLEAPGYEMNEDKNSIQSNLLNKNVSGKISKSRSSYGNQESMALLNFDYLNKDYSNQKILILKFDNVPIQQKLDELKENSNIHKNKKSINKSFRHHMHLSESLTGVRDRTLNLLKMPKRKLGPIMSTMLLLTAKMDDGGVEEHGTMNKPYQYLHEELCQPLKEIIRITLSRRDRYDNNHISKNEALKNVSPDIERKFPTSVSNTAVFACPDVSTDTNHKDIKENTNHIQSDSKDKTELSKHNKRKRNRNVKRYLELKNIIATGLFQLQKRNIHFYGHTWKRQRRRQKRSSIIETVSKVFNDKPPKNYGTKFTIKLRKRIRHRKHVLQNTILFETAFPLESKRNDGSSNFAAMNSNEIQPNNTLNDANFSKKTNESNLFGIENTIKHETTDLQINQHQKKIKKLGFWSKLFLRITRQRSYHIYLSIPRDKLLRNNSCTNYKRRKKDQANDRIQANAVTRIINNDARNYRMSVFLNDHNWFTKIDNYKEVCDVENNNSNVLLGIDSKTSKCSKEIKRLKKEEIQNTKREIKSRQKNEAKSKKAELKTKQDKVKQNTKENTENLSFFCTGNEIKPKATVKNSGFKKILKAISQTTLSTRRGKSNRFIRFNIPECNPTATCVCVDKTATKTFQSNGNVNKNEEKKRSCYHNEKCSSSDEVIDDNDIKTDNSINNVYGSTETENRDNKCSQTSFCCHVWYCEPKKHKWTQTKNKRDNCIYNQLKIKRSCQSKTKPVDTHACTQSPVPSKCQQEVTNKETQAQRTSHMKRNKKGYNQKAYYEPKGLQLKCLPSFDECSSSYDEVTSQICKEPKSQPTTCMKVKRVKHNETQYLPCVHKYSDKKVNVCPEHQSCGCQHEVTSQINKETQAHRTSNMKHNETQCSFPPCECECSDKQINVYSEQESRGCQYEVNSQIKKETAVQTICCEEQNETECAYPPCVDNDLQCLSEQGMVCPKTIIGYADETTSKPRARENVTSVAQRTTSTEVDAMSDVTTNASDWWSPLVEKKEIPSREITKDHHETPNDWEVSLDIDPENCGRDAVGDRETELSASQYLLQKQIYLPITALFNLSQNGYDIVYF